MLNTLKIFEELKEVLDQKAAFKIAEILGTVYSTLADTVTKTEFNELQKTVQDLIYAQRESNSRLDKLSDKIVDLTEKVSELTEAQKRTEEQVNELAEAQKKTEKTIQSLIKRMDDFSEQLGGVSNTIGYNLEDQSFEGLKEVLKKEAGIVVESLYRRNIVYSPTQFDEINIYGEGARKDRKIYVIGESKAQFGPRDVTRFLQLLKRVKKHLKADLFPITLAYQYHPIAEEQLKEAGIRAFWSYEIPKK